MVGFSCQKIMSKIHLVNEFVYIYKMKKILFLTLCLMISSITKAQKVFSVEYTSQADIKIYVADYESRADLSVFTDKSFFSDIGKSIIGFFCFMLVKQINFFLQNMPHKQIL